MTCKRCLRELTQRHETALCTSCGKAILKGATHKITAAEMLWRFAEGASPSDFRV